MSIKKAQSLAEEEKMETSNRNQLKFLKRKLLIYLFLIAFFILLLILDSAFSLNIIYSEIDFIKILQKSFGIDDHNQKMLFLNFIGQMAINRYFFLIVIHFYLFIYFAIDALITIKIMIGHFIGLYFINILQFLYSLPRPFWVDSNIVSYICSRSFSMPDDFLFTIYFMILYSFFCYENRLKNSQVVFESDNDLSLENEVKKIKIIQIIKTCLWLICIFLIVVKYLIGEIFLNTAFLTAIYAIIIYAILVFGETYFDHLIKNTVIEKKSGKRILFFWLIILVLLQCLAAIFYVNADGYFTVEYINNYVEKN